MEDFEKTGAFYLGRRYNLEERRRMEDLLLYDSKDLVTHAVCVGMTGSGKTGLCLGILEEAAIDGVPAIVIDPKGDLTNLLLTFPELRREDFQPWVNEEDARKKGLSLEEYAGRQASLWKEGLAEWGQEPSRIARLREAADFAIYTPGSSAGLPVSILNSFSAPGKAIIEDIDLMTERVNTTATSLLNLLGIEADPIRSREHILLSNILARAWREGQDLSLADLISLIQNPLVKRIGVFDLDSFFPEADRFALAMSINNLLAAPSFASWLEGEPLDIGRLLYTDEAKPRISIMTISHLNDTERMFFVSLLLTQLLGWMRTQPGTSSLRALFYMDEIFGYFPPVANPPSKAPLLSLLKQARAFGLGIVLATQNPVDLDYKGLSNCGTWFLGRLQTERDKERVLDGLEGVGSSSGGRFDRKSFERILTSLGSRVFLMNNVHDDEPVLFQTRWALSYLRGPLTRSQIKTLMDPRRQQTALPGRVDSASVPPAPHPAIQTEGRGKPPLPPGVPEFFMPARVAPPDPQAILAYRPSLIGIARIYYAGAKVGTAEEEISLLTGLGNPVRWEESRKIPLDVPDLEDLPAQEDARFEDLPSMASRPEKYRDWEKEFKDYLYREQSLSLFESPSMKMISAPGESENDFRIRLSQAAREKRDELIEKTRKKYTAKIASLEQQVLRAGQAVEREKDQAGQQRIQTAISLGATLLGALVGRKVLSQTSVGKASTTIRRAGKISKEKKDVERAEERFSDLRSRLEELQGQFEEEVESVKTSFDPATEVFQTVTVRPRKSDIKVLLTGLGWEPFWEHGSGRSPDRLPPPPDSPRRKGA